MYIYEAAHKALQEIGRPTHVSELYSYITNRGYYTFGAKEPENALAIQLSRRASNVAIGHSSTDKLFYRAAPATDGLDEWLSQAADPANTVTSSVEEDVLGLMFSNETTTEKEQLILGRIGQGAFRAGVLSAWEYRCAVTGSTMALRASHIKPWRSCTNRERLDPNNGLPLVATIDALFDVHLVSFDADGRILLSSQIPEHEQSCLGINADMQLRQVVSETMNGYLHSHRQLFIK